MARDSLARGLMSTLHKTLGLTVLALATGRLIWRRMHPAPALRHTAR